MKTISRTIVGAAMAFAVLHSPMSAALAQDSAFVACVQKAAKRDLAGMKAFQTGIRDLIVAQKPEFETLANLHMGLQVAMAQVRVAKLAYLLKHDPARVETGKGLVKFRNFDWSSADDAAMAGEDLDAAARLARIADLRKKNDGHLDWPKLRELMVAELSPSPAFRALIARHSENDRAVRAGLKDCRRG